MGSSERRPLFRRAATLFGGMSALYALLAWLPLQPFGWPVLTSGLLSAFVMTFAALACLLVALGLCVPKRTRGFGVQASVLCLALMLSGIAGVVLDGHIRMYEFERVSDRSQPLIEAIEAYVDENGVAPSSLDELVPRYLAAVPSTGMAAYPAYDLFHHASGDDWALQISTCGGTLDLHWWTRLVYLPSGAYAQYAEAIGGKLDAEMNRMPEFFRDVGRWAYFMGD